MFPRIQGLLFVLITPCSSLVTQISTAYHKSSVGRVEDCSGYTVILRFLVQVLLEAEGQIILSATVDQVVDQKSVVQFPAPAFTFYGMLPAHYFSAMG